MNHRPSSPAAFISASGGGNCFSMVSFTRFQYGLSFTVRPLLPHQTTSPLLTTNRARPERTSLTISRATQSPPLNRNIVRCTPGRSFTSSTEASAIQPLSTVNVMTSVWVMNGMMILMSSLVAGSKIIFTSFCTTASATFSGMTKPNISTNNLTRSGLLPLGGRYIIGRESPTATNEKPRAGSFAAVPFSAAAAGLATTTSTAMNANNIEETFVVCFIFCLPSLLVLRYHGALDPQPTVSAHRQRPSRLVN